jgi:GT2 family glycosyltransferase
MNISVIIPWADRPELLATLQGNARLFEALGAEVIVSNCGGDPLALTALVARIDGSRVRVVDCGGAGFNKCLAINLAAATARSPVLFLMDADVTLDEGFSVPASVAERGCFATLERVIERSSAGLALAPSTQSLKTISFSMTFGFEDAVDVTVETGNRSLADGGRNAPGLILVAAEDFRDVGGMDSRFTHWGWEDIDLIVRLQHVLGRPRVQQGIAYHQTHGDELRNLPRGVTRAESERRNMNLALQKYASGDWMGTLRADIAAATDR